MNRFIFASAFAALSLAACSGDDVSDAPSADAAAEPDAGITPDGGDQPEPSTALAVGGDYGGNGVATRIHLGDLQVETNAVAGVVGGDPVLRHEGDRLYLIDRIAGSITILDSELQLLDQISTGTGEDYVNPQDLALAGDTLYVAALDAPGILVFDLGQPGAGVIETLDLSHLDDEDGKPDCGSVQVVGDRLYAACQLIERKPFPEPWSFRGPGVIAVFDTADGELLTTLELENVNPGGLTATDPDGPFAGDLLVATVPDAFGDATLGCLERVSIGEAPAATGCAAEHAALGGYASSYVELEGSLWVTVTEGDGTGRLVIHDPGAGTWSEGSLLAEGANPLDIASCPDGNVLVADSSEGSRGVHVFAADGSRRTDAPLDVGWPEVFYPGSALACW